MQFCNCPPRMNPAVKPESSALPTAAAKVRVVAEAPNDLGRAALYMVSAAFLFAAMSVMVKLSAKTLPNVMVVFLRSSISLLMITPFILVFRASALRTKNVKDHALRGLVGMGAMYCFFYAIAKLGLAEALLLNYSLPLFIPLVERAWLGQAVARGIWKAIGIGLVGLVLILKPGTEIFQPAAMVGVLAAIFAATAQVGVRGLTRTEPVISIVFYFGVVSTLVSVGPALANWTTPGPELWPTLLALGACASVAQVLMTRAYHHAPAAQVGPFIYTSIVFAGLFDVWLFGRVPDAYAAAGALLVVVAGIAALRTGRSKLVSKPV